MPYTWNEIVSMTNRGSTLRGLEGFSSVGGFPRVILRAQLN